MFVMVGKVTTSVIIFLTLSDLKIWCKQKFLTLALNTHICNLKSRSTVKYHWKGHKMANHIVCALHYFVKLSNR